MAEPRLGPKHLAAPRKLILLVRINKETGDYEAMTLVGEVALRAQSREEMKEKVRVQVRQMHSSVRPSTVRIHFVADQRTWLHSPLSQDEKHENGDTPKTPERNSHTEDKTSTSATKSKTKKG